MDFDVTASTWMPSRPRQPAVTLIYDLQNLTRSSVWASEYSLSVSSTSLTPSTKYRGNKICMDERSNKRTNGRLSRHCRVERQQVFITGDRPTRRADSCPQMSTVTVINWWPRPSPVYHTDCPTKLTAPEMISRSWDMVGAHQNLNGSRDPNTSLSGMVCHLWASTCYTKYRKWERLG